MIRLPAEWKTSGHAKLRRGLFGPEHLERLTPNAGWLFCLMVAQADWSGATAGIFRIKSLRRLAEVSRIPRRQALQEALDLLEAHGYIRRLGRSCAGVSWWLPKYSAGGKIGVGDPWVSSESGAQLRQNGRRKWRRAAPESGGKWRRAAPQSSYKVAQGCATSGAQLRQYWRTAAPKSESDPNYLSEEGRIEEGAITMKPEEAKVRGLRWCETRAQLCELLRPLFQLDWMPPAAREEALERAMANPIPYGYACGEEPTETTREPEASGEDQEENQDQAQEAELEEEIW